MVSNACARRAGLIGGSGRRLCLLLLVLAASSSAQGQVAEGSHESVTGWHIAPGLTLGGWATLQLEVPHGPSVPADGDGETGPAPNHSLDDNAQFTQRTRLGISHLAAMLWWDPAPAWKLLAEVDGQNALQIPRYSGDADGPAASPSLSLERLYIDWRASDEVSVRAGKFLTPVGRWNQEHADPLTWTTTRPLISQAGFPTNMTGLTLFGNVPFGLQGLDYQVYAAGRENWRAPALVAPFEHALGARLVVPVGSSVLLGFSALHFVQDEGEPESNRLLGLDLVAAAGLAEISGEAMRRDGSSLLDSGDRGWFVQAALPIAPRWWLTSRWEAYKRRGDSGLTRSALVGLVYRSGGHWLAKAEWVHPTSSAPGLPQGLLASLTMLY